MEGQISQLSLEGCPRAGRRAGGGPVGGGGRTRRRQESFWSHMQNPVQYTKFFSSPVPSVDCVMRGSSVVKFLPLGYDPLADRPDSPSPSPTPTSRRMVEPPTLRTPALRHPSLTRAPHAHTRQIRRSALKRKEKMGRRRPAGGTPRLCNTPQRGCHRRSCA